MNTPNASFRALLQRPPEDEDVRSQSVDEDAETAFTFGRVGSRPQLTLLFQRASGAVFGYPYANLTALRSEDPDLGFTLEFGDAVVKVTGRNLEMLFQYVCDHKASRIEEARRAAVFGTDSRNAVVESLNLHDSRS